MGESFHCKIIRGEKSDSSWTNLCSVVSSSSPSRIKIYNLNKISNYYFSKLICKRKNGRNEQQWSHKFLSRDFTIANFHNSFPRNENRPVILTDNAFLFEGSCKTRRRHYPAGDRSRCRYPDYRRLENNEPHPVNQRVYLSSAG